MSELIATPEQISALLRTVKDRVVLVRARPVWTGEPTVDMGTRTATVVPGATVLAVRNALVTHRDAELLVVLTDCAEQEIGLDVMARVSRNQVRRLDPWELVRTDLGVTALDPLLAAPEERWILDAFVQHKPAGGWHKPASGLLQRDEAIRQLFELWLGLGDGATVADLVRWLGDPACVAHLAAAGAGIRYGVRRELVRRFPEPAGLLIDLAVAGRSNEIVPLGLAARVLWAASTDAMLLRARARFEVQLDTFDIADGAVRAWSDAAEAVVRQHLMEHGRAAIDAVLRQAEHTVGTLSADAWLAESDVLAGGLERRYHRVGELLDEVVGGRAEVMAEVEQTVEMIERHLLTGDDSPRAATVRAAVRLARRTVQPPAASPPTLPALAVQYRDDGQWLDRARHEIRQGDRSATLAAAYSALLTAVDNEREVVNAEFAEQLRRWSEGEPGDSGAVLPLERVLAEVVAPIAAKAPVLLIVADGMSWPVAGELLDDLRHQGWLTLQADRPVPVGVSLLPTVTEASRTSLLCGRRVIGHADQEAAGFPMHPALRALPGPTPKLFHKALLMTASGEALAPDLRDALVDPAQRVVGVVINAIDDHLSRGQQVRVRWNIDTVTPLRELLAEAAAAGRTVILTSDHGHVLDEGRTSQRGIADSGERWRAATTPAGEGEITITGPRVLLGDGAVVVPASDLVRYGPPKHGYHGGATPQEVLVPIVVLARATSVPDGWGPTVEEPPAWWTGSAAPELRPLPAIAPVAKPLTVAPRPAPAGQVALFDTPSPAPPVGAPTADVPGWLAALLASPTYGGRRPVLLRVRLDDQRVSRLLQALDQRSGPVLKTALAADVDVAPFRLDGLLAALTSVLNLEGYPAIEVVGDSVTLNRSILLTQFGIDG